MKRTNRLLVSAAALLAAAFTAGGAHAQPKVDPARLAAVLAKIDTSGLVPIGTPVIPPATLAWDALAELHPGDAATTLTGETFVPTEDNPQGITGESPNWVYEWRPQRGAAFLAVQEATQMESRKLATSELEDDARSRLASLGIAPGEIGAVDVRKLLTQTRTETTEPTPPELHARKVFVERAIGGIPVLGSRAVFTYGPETDLRKLLLYWAGIGAEANVLTTPLTPAQVALAVARDLVQNGEDDVESVPLTWAYDTEPIGPGEMKLLLRAEGTLRGADGPGENDESNEKVRVRLFDPRRFDAAFCDVETSEADYDAEEQVQVTRLRFANYTNGALPVRLRFQIRLPFGVTVNALDLNLTLPSGLDGNLAATPIGLFTIGGQHPSLFGLYETRCALEHPTTGAVIAEDRAAFEAHEP